LYGVYQGGSELDNNYELVLVRTYNFTTQLRTPKQLSLSETKLIDARNDSSTMKFNGKLEATASDINEFDKEQFIRALMDKVRFYGLETFFYLHNSSGRMVSLMTEYHAFTVDEILNEFHARAGIEPAPILDNAGTETEASRKNRFRFFDDYELDDVALSRLTVESLLTASLREKLETRFSHYARFHNLPGQVIFMMVLDTCNASTELDI
jgi:hypothetical protein